jgi:predicted DNA-binding transcriptional regulator AlpA
MSAKPNILPTSTASRVQLLRINDVVALTTLSKSCVALWVAQGRFPKPIALSSTLKVWRSSDLSEWIDKQFEAAEGDDRAWHPGSAPAAAKAGE